MRLLLKGAEAALPATVGSATSLSNARVVRVVNTATGADHLVTIQDTAGGTTLGSFTVMRSSSEVFEKEPTDVIFAANTAVKASRCRIYQLRKMKLITEEVQKVKFVTEGKGSNKKLYIEGVFLQGNIKNRNGRMYPVETLEREVGRYNESFIQKESTG